ncbi:hypothetical protein F5884DRAFT_757587 [Xylogone sp. PMI_703]|nr:hypothetical protein F5884DRAFT_757587 [Xylogone sp. PMI_703]
MTQDDGLQGESRRTPTSSASSSASLSGPTALAFEDQSQEGTDSDYSELAIPETPQRLQIQSKKPLRNSTRKQFSSKVENPNDETGVESVDTVPQKSSPLRNNSYFLNRKTKGKRKRGRPRKFSIVCSRGIRTPGPKDKAVSQNRTSNNNSNKSTLSSTPSARSAGIKRKRGRPKKTRVTSSRELYSYSPTLRSTAISLLQNESGASESESDSDYAFVESSQHGSYWISRKRMKVNLCDDTSSKKSPNQTHPNEAKTIPQVVIYSNRSKIKDTEHLKDLTELV